MNEQDLIRKAMSALGSRKSKAKSKAARINGAMPCAKGKKRGRPRKKKSKPAAHGLA